MDPKRDRDKSDYIKDDEPRRRGHGWWKWLLLLLVLLAALWAWSQWAQEDRGRAVDELDRGVIEEPEKDSTDNP